MVSFSDLSLEQYLQLFGYLFLPILVFGVFLWGSIVLSNRMGGKNKLIVFVARAIFSGAVIVGLIYYFYYFLTVILVG